MIRALILIVLSLPAVAEPLLCEDGTCYRLFGGLNAPAWACHQPGYVGDYPFRPFSEAVAECNERGVGLITFGKWISFSWVKTEAEPRIQPGHLITSPDEPRMAAAITAELARYPNFILCTGLTDEECGNYLARRIFQAMNEYTMTRVEAHISTESTGGTTARPLE